MISDKVSTFCTFPWEMYSADSGFGWWRPCPRIDYQSLEDKDFFNHKRLIELRENLRRGVQDNMCQRCWDDEKRGVKSYRQVLGQDTRPENFNLNRVPVPKIFEVKFSNLCNLKCVFCSNRCSSLWEQENPFEESELGPIRGEHVARELIEYFVSNYDAISTLQIFGGEPALHPEFSEFIDILCKAPANSLKKELSLSTNLFFSNDRMEKFIFQLGKILEKGHRLYLRISIDGIEEQGEYLRTGLKWRVFHSNLISLRNFLEKKNNIGRVKCNIALNILNLTYLSSILNYLKVNKMNWIEPHYNYIGKPERFMLQSYGSRLKVAAQIIVTQDFSGYERYRKHVLDLIGSMVSLPPDLSAVQDCRTWISSYDKMRGTHFLKTFPLNSYIFKDEV